MPFGHMRNIAGLQLLSDPGAIPETLATFARLRGGFASEARRHRVLEPAIRAGSVGVPNREQSALVSALGHLGPVAKPVQKWYDASGKMLWAFDDAANYAQTVRNIRRGMTPERAAYEARRSLVDYNNVAPATEAARYAMPFGTWRTRMPTAVARSVVKHPQNALALGRAVPMTTGARQDAGGGQASSMSTPLGELARGIDDPLGYTRGSLSTTLRIGANVPWNAAADRILSRDPIARQRAHNFFTYGAPALPYAATQLPFIGLGLDVAGKGLFPKKPGQAVVEQVTGVRTSKAPKPPTPFQRFSEAYARAHPQATQYELLRAWRER